MPRTVRSASSALLRMELNSCSCLPSRTSLARMAASASFSRASASSRARRRRSSRSVTSVSRSASHSCRAASRRRSQRTRSASCSRTCVAKRDRGPLGVAAGRGEHSWAAACGPDHAGSPLWSAPVHPPVREARGCVAVARGVVNTARNGCAQTRASDRGEGKVGRTSNVSASSRRRCSASEARFSSSDTCTGRRGLRHRRSSPLAPGDAARGVP